MKNIPIVFTGGTIAMRTNADGQLVPAVSGAELIESIPALQNMATISTLQFANIPSAQMNPERMLALRQTIIELLAHEANAGLVIVHGTDTMEETAFFLDASLSNLDLSDKPVAITGAMRSNDQYSADGAANLLAAVQVAASPLANQRGVLLVMNDQIHAARYVKKMDTASLNTFCSPQYMALGNSDHHGIDFKATAQRYTPVVDVSRETTQLPRVDIVCMYAGADASAINASIAAGAKAIVVQAVGASSVNLELYEAIHASIQQGVGIVIASRSPLGLCTPVYGYLGGGKTLAELGAAFSHDLPAHKARLYAQLLINQHTSLTTGFAQLRDA